MKSRAFLASVLTAVVFTGFSVEAQRANAALAPQPTNRSNGNSGGTPVAGPVVGAPLPGPIGGINPPTTLLPRAKVRKPAQESFVLPFDPETGEAWFTGNLVLKFEDFVGARASRTDSPAPFSANGSNIEAFSQILADNKLTVRQWINRSPAELASLEERARGLEPRVTEHHARCTGHRHTRARRRLGHEHTDHRVARGGLFELRIGRRLGHGKAHRYDQLTGFKRGCIQSEKEIPRSDLAAIAQGQANGLGQLGVIPPESKGLHK